MVIIINVKPFLLLIISLEVIMHSGLFNEHNIQKHTIYLKYIFFLVAL